MKAVRIILKKASIYLTTFILLSMFSFYLFFVFPGDPATLIARHKMGGEIPPPQIVENLKRELKLNVSPYRLYIKWLRDFIQGDWGKSFLTGEPVLKEIKRHFVMTLYLTISTFAIAFPLSLITGVIAALKEGKRMDNLVLLFLITLDSTPSFFLGLTLMMLLGVKLRILPIAGSNSLKNAILPALTLSASYVAVTSRITRNSIIKTLKEEFILFAKAKGLPKWQIFRRHVFRNAMIPIVTYAGLELAWLFQGSAVVEKLFGWPGIGSLTVEAAMYKDLPLLQGCLMSIGTVFILINGITDLLYIAINPQLEETSDEIV
ncbi:MAG: peptide/nickel transport system permease protein [bacterium]|nr:peptide/nickel transport system permease protein [bacterium]